MNLRRVPPAHSPVAAEALPWAAARAVGLGPDATVTLRARLARDFGARRVVLCGSGTAALALAIRRALRTSGADRVALPAYTCYAVAAAAVSAGPRISLYDVDPGTLAPDLDDLERAVAGGARAVVVTPLFGVPVDWEEIEARLAPHDAIVIEDAAQGHGAAWRGRPLGAFGRLSVLSFGRGKGWTGGGGGALLWRGRAADESRDVFAVENTRDSAGREARASVVLAAQWLLGRPSLYGLPTAIPALGLGQTIYHEPTPPSPMARTAAAMLLASEEGAAAEVSYRRNNARRYATALDSANEPHAVIGRHFDDTSGALRFPVRVPGGWSVVRQSEAPRMGAAPGYPSTLADIPALRPLRLGRAVPLPGAELLARDLFTLPTHSLVSHSEADRLAGIVRTLFASGSRSQSQR